MVVICTIVLTVITSSVVGMVTLGGAAVIGAGGNRGGEVEEAEFEPDSLGGRLGELGRQLEQSSAEFEAAQESGDADGQATAAINALGALLGGGTRVEPVALDELRPFVPETFVGLPRTSTEAERTGLAGIMVATAEAAYGDGADRYVTLELQDTGGMSGVMGLAGWMSGERQREDESSAERTERVDGRLVHEKLSKNGGTHEFNLVLRERFVVNATGRGITLDELKSAVSDLDLAGLETMADAQAP